ncbi:hypothetical protein O9K51_07822 [Purpureocillium lavendulum]|uniref:Uncharacterized protein n=1 Tax=Purpureocillium lavendulum TaxID=1247861 RepID=A0AB34FNI6_9HYPO|nr:hypothetical protein O9K51_07822 [Purpureocillium lavendulum]
MAAIDTTDAPVHLPAGSSTGYEIKLNLTTDTINIPRRLTGQASASSPTGTDTAHEKEESHGWSC